MDTDFTTVYIRLDPDGGYCVIEQSIYVSRPGTAFEQIHLSDTLIAEGLTLKDAINRAKAI